MGCEYPCGELIEDHLGVTLTGSGDPVIINMRLVIRLNGDK